MEKERTQQERDETEVEQKQHQPPYISPLQPLTKNAYGGGMYGTEEGQSKDPMKPPASETQSADGPAEATAQPKHKPPPSTGDKNLDITGQSYIQ
ncbi:Mediator of RNA polymerase II transcription subunit 26 [Dorcoceras hygrometricum]|uniref:Mediator of RNA polymerase II transcription subunit 26 n=1 Tax=Dorcoceras hygrometricum TaxID=472368 RepID=A0A2Z7AFK5_9LAMI|nr:Mediator of RNA polymerase II transcription subunit 26 [Dorcoceras hygrometricum]